MSWFDNLRPKIQALVTGNNEVPDNLWRKCDNCGQMIFHRDLQSKMYVCQYCDHHMHFPVKDRLENLFDPKTFKRIETPSVPLDPIKFRDRKRYTDRLKEAQTTTGDQDAILVASGKISDMPIVIAAFNFKFMAGSMGMAVGEAIVTAAKLAIQNKAPLLTIPASGGARMQESILSLMQMPRTTLAVQQVKEAGLPYIVLLTNPTTGGVSASFAMLGDIHIAEPGAMIGFAGRRVIEQTVRETLPENFQTAEYLKEHGIIDMVVHRKDLRDMLTRLIRLLTHPVESAPPREAKPATINQQTQKAIPPTPKKTTTLEDGKESGQITHKKQ